MDSARVRHEVEPPWVSTVEVRLRFPPNLPLPHSSSSSSSSSLLLSIAPKIAPHDALRFPLYPTRETLLSAYAIDRAERFVIHKRRPALYFTEFARHLVTVVQPAPEDSAQTLLQKLRRPPFASLANPTKTLPLSASIYKTETE
ncbi:hypothetical protein BHE74_00048432 [Ensete ventricosum]|nr:hypothetical protein BHE74_00048432 [Ensete ventricosum]